MNYFKELSAGWKGVLVSVLCGLAAILVKNLLNSPIAEPLLLALILGIALRSFIKFGDSTKLGFKISPMLFIPVGVVFYGAVNLNFKECFSMDPDLIFMLFIVFIIYVIASIFLSSLFRLKEKTGYLLATGSAICGASAIVVASQAIDAEPDDVSISLISVFLSALFGLFFVLPFLSSVLNIQELDYGYLSGTILQFTGFVKFAVAKLSSEAKTLALSVKAVRYIGLLFIIPLFASFVKGKLYIPWYLWAFLIAGLVSSFLPGITKPFIPVFKQVLDILWSMAMAAIGLNANLKNLFTKQGAKAFMVSFLSFVIAAAAILVTKYLF
jgi:uncharacterized integral membrane protein (TIGR00698 family)